MAVELTHEPDEELDEPARQLVENVHGVGGRVACTALFLAAYLLEEILVQRVKGGVLGRVDESKSLLRGVAELLFNDKGSAVAVALIVVFVCDKAVELRRMIVLSIAATIRWKSVNLNSGFSALRFSRYLSMFVRSMRSDIKASLSQRFG